MRCATANLMETTRECAFSQLRAAWLGSGDVIVSVNGTATADRGPRIVRSPGDVWGLKMAHCAPDRRAGFVMPQYGKKSILTRE